MKNNNTTVCFSIFFVVYDFSSFQRLYTQISTTRRVIQRNDTFREKENPVTKTLTEVFACALFKSQMNGIFICSPKQEIHASILVFKISFQWRNKQVQWINRNGRQNTKFWTERLQKHGWPFSLRCDIGSGSRQPVNVYIPINVHAILSD